MIVYLSLGSNMGDRVGLIQQAIRLLTDHPTIRLLSASSFYETEPVDNTDQPWFVNVAVAIETTLPPETLLTICQEIEARLGRTRSDNDKGPRLLDIDILFYGDLVMNEPDLTIPHPRLHQRAFMLVPMLEINSRMVHPTLKRTIEQLHDALENPEEVLLYGTRRALS